MNNKGLSIIEIIISIAILAIIASSSVVAILSSFNSNRLSQEETKAAELADEALSALTSIASQDWESITGGTYGLTQTGSAWQLSPSPDITDGKYTRTISLTQSDNETYQAQIEVTWNFTPTRSNSVHLTTLLTNWQTSKGSQATIPTPTPTTSPDTCSSHCQSLGYSTGICRSNAATCTANSQTHEIGGDVYCTGGQSVDTCCCTP